MEELVKKLRKAINNNEDVRGVLENHYKKGARDAHLVIPVWMSSFYFGEGVWLNGRGPLLKKSTAEVIEALRFKNLGTGCNLLMYAANEGKERSFDSLINSIKYWVSKTCK